MRRRSDAFSVNFKTLKSLSSHAKLSRVVPKRRQQAATCRVQVAVLSDAAMKAEQAAVRQAFPKASVRILSSFQLM